MHQCMLREPCTLCRVEAWNWIRKSEALSDDGHGHGWIASRRRWPCPCSSSICWMGRRDRGGNVGADGRDERERQEEGVVRALTCAAISGEGTATGELCE